MKLKDQIHAIKLLENFSDEIQNFKKKLIKEHIKKKFNNLKLLVALEKLTEYEFKIYKKFNQYYSFTTDIEIQQLYNNFSEIKKKCQQFVESYIKEE